MSVTANERVAKMLYEGRRDRLLVSPTARQAGRIAMLLGTPLTTEWADLPEGDREFYRTEAWPLTKAALGDPT